MLKLDEVLFIYLILVRGNLSGIFLKDFDGGKTVLGVFGPQ